MNSFKSTKIYLILLLSLAAYCLDGYSQEITNLTNARVVNEKDSIKKKNEAITNITPADTTPQTTVTGQAAQNPFQMYNVHDSVIENRLVQLALSQPDYAKTLYEQKIFEYQLKKQRNAWLNLLTISTTYNDQSFAKPSSGGTTAYVYPKFYLGVTIPVGLFVSNSTDVKITKQSELIARSQQVELAKSIKASVLSNYKQYKANEKLLLIQNQSVDDEQASFLKAEEKFRNGTSTLEVYNEASRKYNDEMIRVINLQLQQDLIKLELERLIGRKLEDVLK